ncbi:DUF167 domain-containing protein [Paracoccus sp. Z330]|uniref:UPF0235 protein PAF17_08040 n=1 Tax=Paracoccus onchidii TaxID=3017813 RepID=A0ABT4ZDU9_9RHOB|nr:DUF167 domain-containing protein [Paracoccus onchidii]MDB6177462.1 DUF167 domain-containing protein [Paracoccus onchidii]
MTDLRHLAQPGAEIALRATPRAARNQIRLEDGLLRVYVTAAPEKGKANDSIRKLLAKSLGVAKTRLVLVRGEASREKMFRLD